MECIVYHRLSDTYPTVYFKFEINSGWTNFEGGKGKGLVRCVRE